jgi:hypothetical protein
LAISSKYSDICISYGNSKIGRVANVSLPTGITCPSGVPCLTHDCYARGLELYNKVRLGWSRNWDTYQEWSVKYFGLIDRFLDGYSGKFFRWHVGGDIPEQRYMNGMHELAFRHPKIRFACWTKRYELDFSDQAFIPDNMNIILSTWPGYPLPANIELPKAWYQDGSETRIPKGTMACKGHCPNCMICWYKERSVDVIHYKKKQLRIFSHASK